MDAGVPDTASTSTQSLCISTPRTGHEKRIDQDRGSPLWHDSVHMEAARTGRGPFPVRGLGPPGYAAMGPEVAPSGNQLSSPHGLPPSVEKEPGQSHFLSVPPPQPGRLANQGPRDHPPVVGPCLPVHGRPKSQLQRGATVDPGREQPSPPSIQPPPSLTIVHPSPPFIPRPAWSGSTILQDHAIPDPKESLPTPVPWGKPNWKPVPWTRMDLDSSITGSYSYSGTRHKQASSSASEYLSIEDPLIVENAHHFPPRFPTDPPFSSTHSRSSARKKIHWWISHHQDAEIAGSERAELENVLVEGDDMALSVSSSESSHMEIEELWRQLNEKRSGLRDLKLSMASKRKKMKKLRLQKTDADNAFMSTIRPMMVNKSGPHEKYALELDGRMAEMQTLRTEYQDLEAGYEELEDKAEEEERQLERIELRFFSLLGSAESESSECEDLASSGLTGLPSSDLPDDLLGISSEKPLEDWHPLFVRLTLAVASLHNLQEEHLVLIRSKKFCDEDVATKRTTGQKISREMAEFLIDFPTRVKEKESELYEINEEVRRLRQMCEERDVMGKHLSARMEKALYPDLELEDMKLPDEETILAENWTLAHPIFTELLSQPDHLLAAPEPHTPQTAKGMAETLPDSDPGKFAKLRIASKEVQIDDLVRSHDHDGAIKTGYINRWLLHNLRTSPLNAMLLHSVFNTTNALHIRDIAHWQRDVLRYWWMDSTRTNTHPPETSDRSPSHVPPQPIVPRSRPVSERYCPMTAHLSHRRTNSVT